MDFRLPNREQEGVTTCKNYKTIGIHSENLRNNEQRFVFSKLTNHRFVFLIKYVQQRIGQRIKQCSAFVRCLISRAVTELSKFTKLANNKFKALSSKIDGFIVVD